jgi:hypothetical protein
VSETQSVGQEDVDRLPDQIFSWVTELPFELLVDQDNRAIGSNHENAARKRLGGEPKKAVGLNSGPR